MPKQILEDPCLLSNRYTGRGIPCCAHISRSLHCPAHIYHPSVTPASPRDLPLHYPPRPCHTAMSPPCLQAIMARAHVKYCFLLSSGISSVAMMNILTTYEETLPPGALVQFKTAVRARFVGAEMGCDHELQWGVIVSIMKCGVMVTMHEAQRDHDRA